MKKRWWLHTNSFDSWLRVKFILLLLPVVFWSCVFLAVAGVWPVEKMIGVVPDVFQIGVALGCPLMGVVLGVKAAAQLKRQDARGAALSWGAVAAGAVLFAFALVVALRPA